MQFLLNIINRILGVKGINLGAGRGWRKIRWVGLDQVSGIMLDKNTKLPFSDSTIEFIFSEHFFEHLDDQDLDNLLSESHRVLKKGGKIRIITPNFEKILNKYRQGDREYFFETVGFRGRKEWGKFGVQPSLENILGHWFANYDSKDSMNDPDFYRGPPIGLESEIKKKANELTLRDFSNWIVSKIPESRFKKPHGHINWFSYDRLSKLLTDKGFEKIKQSSCNQSKYSEFLDDKFDRKSRASISLYVEAEKM